MSATTQDTQHTLRKAAQAALWAPSIFNTQPWRWQLAGEDLRLWADRERQLAVADPQGRLLTISCGAALHHARVTLAAEGHQTQVTRLPDPADPDLLAVLGSAGPLAATTEDARLFVAIARRRTDRRVFHGEPVPAPISAAMVAAAEAQGAHLHLVRREQVAQLAFAAVHAGALELTDPDYRRELIRWTHRPTWSGDGVPVGTAVEMSPRAVPVRDFEPYGGSALSPGPGTDHDALYAVIFTDQDDPAAWLRAGEALSAVLLTATAAGLSTSPISDVTELAVTRERLRELLAGIGVPQLAVRVGHGQAGAVPASPRRPADEVIFA